MADESSSVVRKIDWRQVFPWTVLFKSFRVAIHPSKIVLALLLLLFLYVGGRLLDSVWPGVHDSVFLRFLASQAHQVTSVAEGVRDMDVSRVVGAVGQFFIIGPKHAFVEHPVYASIYTLYLMFVWSIFGGAIARVAAVHVARDEKISVRQALRFSVSKFLSFFSAPLIPSVIVAGIVLSLGVASLVGNVPFVGPIVVGALFFVAIIASFVVTLILIGTFGGLSLMYPTIAVEGSDSFDAISRSFSYVYARPWRMLFYTALSVVYGGLTYLFVRGFIWLLLVVAHASVDTGMLSSAKDGTELWNAMWPDPTHAERLTHSTDYANLSGGAKVGAFMVGSWVYLVVSVLGAFAISFYFSANTIIYFLMRHDVDATEMDDVHIEQDEDDFLDKPVALEATPAAPVALAPAAPVAAEPTTPAPALVTGDPVPAVPAPVVPVDGPPATEPVKGPDVL